MGGRRRGPRMGGWYRLSLCACMKRGCGLRVSIIDSSFPPPPNPPGMVCCPLPSLA